MEGRSESERYERKERRISTHILKDDVGVQRNMEVIDNITIISGYWRIPNKYSHDHYNQWFQYSLKINQLTYFFCENQEEIDYIKQFRDELPTIYIIYPLARFNSNRFYNPHWIHPTHVPSSDLGKIWHEKIHLMKLVKDNYQPDQEFFIWCDAGVCVYRDHAPPPIRLNLKDINSLPHDKFCYSDPEHPYEHHNFSGTVYIIHRDLIDTIYDLYMEYVDKCAEKYNDWRCGSDQFILTEMMKDHPHLFYKLACGYGMNIQALYDTYV